MMYRISVQCKKHNPGRRRGCLFLLQLIDILHQFAQIILNIRKCFVVHSFFLRFADVVFTHLINVFGNILDVLLELIDVFLNFINVLLNLSDILLNLVDILAHFGNCACLDVDCHLNKK